MSHRSWCALGERAPGWLGTAANGVELVPKGWWIIDYNGNKSMQCKCALRCRYLFQCVVLDVAVRR